MSKKNLAHKLGTRGEKFSCTQLQWYGLKILQKNFSIPDVGEIDIIARDGLSLCFVEVKTRQVSKFSNPRDAVDWHKRLKFWKVSMAYLRQIDDPHITYRFDMIEVFAKKRRIIATEYLTHIFNDGDIKKVI